jgi:hypothetical protein
MGAGVITLGEGLHPDVPEDVYHRDPCEQASLSSSIARVLLGRSPLHAWERHPRLNPAWQEDEAGNDRARDMGSAAHALMLGTGREVKLVQQGNYKTTAAKDAAASARAEGKIPLLQPDFDAVQELVAKGKAQLAKSELAGIFDDGDAELTMVWKDGPSWCRSRIDYLPRVVRQGGHVIVPDYKTTAGSAHPDDFARTLFEQGYDVQAAFYERGLRKLIPTLRTVEFVFVVQEQDPPHAMSIVGLSGQALELAQSKVDVALRTWSLCLLNDVWPGYSSQISRIEVPNWRAERTELNNMVMLDRLAKWQAPLGAAK